MVWSRIDYFVEGTLGVEEILKPFACRELADEGQRAAKQTASQAKGVSRKASQQAKGAAEEAQETDLGSKAQEAVGSVQASEAGLASDYMIGTFADSL